MVVRTETESVSHSIRDYINVTKPTITLLVIITTIPGLLLTDQLASLWVMLATLLGAACASASASTFNQALEMDIDHNMGRTRKRSVPAGRVKQSYAFAWGAFLALLGALFLCSVNVLAAVVAFSGHLFYVLVYTSFLKMNTPQNIVIGGMAGAVGPLIGCAAVTGTLSGEAWLLFLLITLWTPPHFWALAIRYKDEYASVSIPMYPVVYGVERTKKAIFLYTLTLLIPVVGIYALGSASVWFLVLSLALTLEFIRRAWVLLRTEGEKMTMPLFHFSCIYTFAYFGVYTLDRILPLL